jgi:hypothetical protein
MVNRVVELHQIIKGIPKYQTIKNPKLQETEMEFTRTSETQSLLCSSIKPIRKTNPQERQKKFHRKEKKRYLNLVVVVSEDMTVKENLC